MQNSEWNNMADDAETLVTQQEVSLEVGEKQEEVIPRKVEEPAPEGSAESSGDKAVKEVEGENKPEDVPLDVLAAETVNVETVPDVKPEAEVLVPEARKKEEEAAIETILKVKQEDEPLKVVAANQVEEESIRVASEPRILKEEAAEAVPQEVIKETEEPKEVAEADNEKQIEITTVVKDVSENAVIEEALEDKKEEGQETATRAAVEEAKDESKTGSNAKAAVAEAEVTDPVKPEKKQSRNVISRMKRSFSKVKKALSGKLPGSKTAEADPDAKAEENAE